MPCVYPLNITLSQLQCSIVTVWGGHNSTSLALPPPHHPISPPPPTSFLRPGHVQRPLPNFSATSVQQCYRQHKPADVGRGELAFLYIYCQHMPNAVVLHLAPCSRTANSQTSQCRFPRPVQQYYGCTYVPSVLHRLFLNCRAAVLSAARSFTPVCNPSATARSLPLCFLLHQAVDPYTAQRLQTLAEVNRYSSPFLLSVVLISHPIPPLAGACRELTDVAV